MQSRPRRIVVAIADALFEPAAPPERIASLTTEVLAFVSSASFVSRVTLRAALALIRFAPILLFASWRPFERLDRARRQEILARAETSAFGLALVAWRTLLILHFYEDARELARVGYTDDRKRHLALIPAPAESGVRLKDDVDEVHEEEKGAA